MSFSDIQLDLPHTSLKRWKNNNMRRGYTASELQSMAESQLSLVSRGLPPCIHPLIVTPGPGLEFDKTKKQQLFIVAGSRRHAGNATLGKGAPLLNCIVRFYKSESDLVAAMRVENGQRKDLSPLEWGVHFEEALKAGEQMHQLVEESGKSKHQINLYTSILKLEPSAQELVDKGSLPLGAIQYLLAIKDEKKQAQTAKRFAAHKYSLKRMESAVALLVAPKEKHKNKIARPATNDLPSYIPATMNDLRGAAAITCRSCDIGVRLTVNEPAWHMAMAAAGEVCDTCDIKNIKNMCAGCPLSSMLSRVARTIAASTPKAPSTPSATIEAYSVNTSVQISNGVAA